MRNVRGRIRWPDKELTGMRLNEGIIGKVYKVTDVNVDEQITRRLEALGVNEQTSITILDRKSVV